MENTTGTTVASVGSKHFNLKKSCRQSLHFLLVDFAFGDFSKAFPSFTRAEQEQLFQIHVQVIASLYEHMLDDFDLICHETKVAAILDNVEVLMEQRRLDSLYSQKSNLGHLRHELLTLKQNEVGKLKEALDKVEDRKHSIKSQIKLLKKTHQNSSVTTDAIEQFRLAMPKCGDYN